MNSNFNTENSLLSTSGFKGLVDNFYDQQSQESLLEIEDFFLSAPEPQFSRSGKNVELDIDTGFHLPPVTIKSNDSVGTILDRYIADLTVTGNRAEAQAIGMIYKALVKGNYASVPTIQLAPAAKKTA